MSLRLLALNLALSAVVSVSAFSVMSTHAMLQQGTCLFTGASTSAEYDLPEDAPKRNSEDSSSSRLPAEMEEALSDARRERFEMEEEAKQRFVSGDDLHLLRQKVLGLREDLKEARANGATALVTDLEFAILEAQQVDAEFVYSVSKERMCVAQEAGLSEEALMWEREAKMARSVLPQFNLDGLWVGKYSEQGFEMINVTYAGPHGDTLIARKLTCKKNVPKGQVTFQVDLSDKATMGSNNLEPIELKQGAAKQWGSRFLHRYAGKGQVSAEGFRNSQWMEGHLILVNEYFSFAWLPIGHQVFFGRPSAELTLKLLKESHETSPKDPARDFLRKCLEETESLEEEMEDRGDPFFSHDQHDYYHHEGCFE